MSSSPDPVLPPSIPPPHNIPPVPKKVRWPWILGGCGCLTIITLCAGTLVTLYVMGVNAKHYDFGSQTWKRDIDGAYQTFNQAKKEIFFETAGEKYGGVVHASGYYRLEGNTLIYRLTNAWVDKGRGGDDPGQLSQKDREELGFTREQRRKLEWVDPNMFKLKGEW
ncbi:MAG: hypothetical protein M3O09_00005, partial [Acidobacteriota bacterium]|nr:hypothetical protein [Acidobacteriota bacterium]